MIIDAASLAIFIPAVFLLKISPWPDVIFITPNSLTSGKCGEVLSAPSVASRDFTHSILAALGLTAIVTTWQPAYEAVRIGGALYLAYLGVKLFLSKESPLTVKSAENKKTGRRLSLEGYLKNRMTPEATLIILTFLPQFTYPERGPIWAQTHFLGAELFHLHVDRHDPLRDHQRPLLSMVRLPPEGGTRTHPIIGSRSHRPRRVGLPSEPLCPLIDTGNPHKRRSDPIFIVLE